MGLLAENKIRRKISTDPNNTKWTRDTTTFGHKILRSQGWQPGEYLGAKDAPQAELYTAANASFIRVAMKDDMKGLGFNRAKDDEVTGLDIFSDLLSRLNGKSEAAVEDDRQARVTFKTHAFVDRRWGPMRFVKGGLLVGDEMKEAEVSEESSAVEDVDEEMGNAEVATSAEVKKEKKSKKRKASSDDDDDESASGATDKKRRRKEEKRAKKDKKEKRKAKKDMERTQRMSGIGQASTSSDDDENDSASGNRIKLKKSKSKSKKSEGQEQDAKEHKKSKAERKEKKRRKREETGSADPSPALASVVGSATGTGQSTPTGTGTGASTPRGSRNFVRSRFIAQKREAVLDAKALNQIFMLKA